MMLKYLLEKNSSNFSEIRFCRNSLCSFLS